MQSARASVPRAHSRRVPPHFAGASPRVVLQLRAHETVRRHFVWSLIRVAVLLTSDFAAFLLLGELMTLARDQAAFGGGLAGTLQQSLPYGYLEGWRFAAALFVGLLVARNYGQGDRRRDGARLLLAVLLAAGLSSWQNIWLIGLPRVALQFAVTAGSFWVTLFALRRGIDWVVSRVRSRSGRAERVLFLGDPSDDRAREVYANLVRVGMSPLGWVTYTNGQGVNGNGAGNRERLLSSPEDIWLILQELVPDTLVLAGHLPEDLFHSVIDASAAAGCRTLLVQRIDWMGRFRPGMAWHHGMPFLELSVPGLTVPHLLLKRSIDIVGCIAALIVLAPVLALMALLIKLDSPGPVVFTQPRVGLGGKIFQVFKFRTMRDGAEAEKQDLAHLNHTGDPRLFKIPNDPRVTKIGAWLRRWSLDELPQLWNVLTGEMSLVGPRPFPLSDMAGYKDHHFVRFCAKPGITGLWQVNGRSDVVDFEEVVRLDQEYIERWSAWLDLSIIFQTLPAVFRRSGAY